jgi:hypothetical protein
MTADLRATVGYDAFKKDGKQLFIKAMTDSHAGQRMATDLQTLTESAWAQKGAAGSAMMLCRLVGYLEGMASTLGSIQSAGVSFMATAGLDGTLDLRVSLFANQPNSHRLPEMSELDTLDGPAYEAALEKMTDAERQKYLESA